MMPLPAWIRGCSAAISISAARSTSSGAGTVGAVRRYWCGAQNAGSAFTLVFMMFSGTSMCTTPGRPSQDFLSAMRTSSGIRSNEEITQLHFAILPITPDWSKHW